MSNVSAAARAVSLVIALLLATLAGAWVTNAAIGQSAISSVKQPPPPAATELDEQTISLLPKLGGTDTPREAVLLPKGTKFTVEAGPLRSTKHAAELCPNLCTKHAASFTSQWWTTIAGKMSVCQCQAK